MTNFLEPEIVNTIIVPIIIPDYIERFLYTLYKYTPPNFRVIVIDQTLHGVDSLTKDPRVHMYIRPYRNLGFAHAMNTGIRISSTKYVTCANDDVEFINSRWWNGIEDTFASDKQIKAVNPMSIAEPGWGYGCNKNSPEELVKQKEQELGCTFNRENERFEHLPYKQEYTEADYDYLLTRKNGCIDGIITWCTVFDRESLNLKGVFDEKFYPGGGEDYDIGGRFYSIYYPDREHPNSLLRYRMVAPSNCWAWHHLSKSRNTKEQYLPGNRTNFGNDHYAWEDHWTHPTLAKFRSSEVARVLL